MDERGGAEERAQDSETGSPNASRSHRRIEVFRDHPPPRERFVHESFEKPSRPVGRGQVTKVGELR